MPILSRNEGLPLNGRSRLARAEPALDPALGGRVPGAEAAADRSAFFETCANPGCASGWLHLWRSRQAPVFEGGWSCSAPCTASLVAAALSRELEGGGGAQQGHRHRIPLGLLMLEQGWLSAGQLRRALDAQRGAGSGRLGHWLTRREGVSEQLVTRALGLQWSCPVLPAEFNDAEALAVLLPRLFVEALGALPLRLAAGRLLYLGFEDRLDPVAALAVERMSGLRVECGLVRESLFGPAHRRMLSARFPSADLIEAGSEPALARALAGAIERARPVASRLARVHEYLWLRMWREAQTGPIPERNSIQDLICWIGAH
jgi:hypothetical protein